MKSTVALCQSLCPLAPQNCTPNCVIGQLCRLLHVVFLNGTASIHLEVLSPFVKMWVCPSSEAGQGQLDLRGGVQRSWLGVTIWSIEASMCLFTLLAGAMLATATPGGHVTASRGHRNLLDEINLLESRMYVMLCDRVTS